ncbi:hypothetical protein [Sulfurisphaera ohwakuensis]|uniref:Uncharacterized protein n=1 Tax=Sulfurisphaera ohwakuensis TaxID=69656 RepID=A0A650CFD7_SULOH|nr:hypothetical protein [Sulfurisphaera ohwakuensis]MBB5255119.1 hypothetical protein [Sulfurisphaera ohwakuensis]QGR16560.1 hypothetical protein D1869_04635 [Sulfurisphaera ohwakuensis]
MDRQEPHRISLLKWLGLFSLFVVLPTAVSVFISFSIPYYIFHNPTLANNLSTIVSIIVIVISSYFFNRYLLSHNMISPFTRSRKTITVLPDSGEPIDEKYIRSFEAGLNFYKNDPNEYIKRLAMIGLMYLQNAIAYANKDYYLKARDYLYKAEEEINGKNVTFETRLLVDNLRSKIKTYKYRFGER